MQDEQTIKIGFLGEFGPNRVSPRELTSSLISSLVNVEGIVTKCSLVRPKVVKSVHYAEATGHFTTKQYRCGKLVLACMKAPLKLSKPGAQ